MKTNRFAVYIASLAVTACLFSQPTTPINNARITGTSFASSSSASSLLAPVLTIAALEAMPVTGLTTNTSINVIGYHSANDVGGGIFTFTTSSSATVDHGLVCSTPSGGTTRWLRVYDGDIYADWFGADPTGTNDSTYQIQKAITASYNGCVRLTGVYITDTILLGGSGGSGNNGKSLKLIGISREKTWLRAKNSNSPIIAADQIEAYSQDNLIENITFQAHASGSTGFAVDLTGISWSYLRNIAFAKNGSGKWTKGIKFYAGTSPYGHCYSNTVENIFSGHNSAAVTDCILSFQGSANVHRIIDFSVNDETLVHVVEHTSPNGEHSRDITFVRPHWEGVNCTGGAMWEIGNGQINLIAQDGWFENDNTYTATLFNAANTSPVLLLSSNVSGTLRPVFLPDNFQFLNGDIGSYGIVSNMRGIGFLSSQQPSENPNTLDDYAEGIWTPVLRGSGTAGTMTGTVIGNYIKIGRHVYCEFTFNAAGLMGAVGTLQISGLPFVPDNGTPFNSVPTVDFSVCDLLASPSTARIIGYGGPGSSIINISTCDNSSDTSLPVGNMKSVGNIYLYGKIHYIAKY